MVNVEKYGNFKPIGKQKKKKLVILCHTSREVGEYLASLMFRYNGSYDKIPNYVITRRGKIFQLLDDKSHSKYFSDENINRNSIIISLENLGWLEKKPLSNDYINWNGSIYNEQVYEKKWRDFFFWQPYTSSQIQVTAELCNQLMSAFQIERRCVGHNTKVEGIKNYEGVITRSNFDTIYTDLNPSFNFETFTKLLENEQLA